MTILGFDLQPLKDGVQAAFATLRQASQGSLPQPTQAVSRDLTTQPVGLVGQAWQTLGQVAQGGGGLQGQAWQNLDGGGFGNSDSGMGGLTGRAWQTLGGVAGNFGGGLSGRAWDTVGAIGPATIAPTPTLGAGATAGATAAGTAHASGGQYGNHEQYRAYIQQYAAANGIDPDALAAILQIEVPSGDPRATSGAGARGLGQIMPGTWAGLADPGDDPYNPEHSIKNAAKYYGSLYRQFGDYGLAAAAYQGGPGAIVNGKARGDINDGNMTPEQYAAAWAQNYQGIKTTAPKQGASGMAPVTPHGYSFPVVGYQGQVQLHHGEDQGASDIMAPEGTAIAAMRGGKVLNAGWNSLGGWTVTIQGDDGLTYYYAHMQNEPGVRTGQTVGAGVQIGAVGTTGNAQGTPPHLHLGIGYGIASGAGSHGGAGENYNAVDLLSQVYGGY